MNDFVMRQVSFAPSLVCNLKCKLCAPASPYYNNLKPMPLDKACETVRRYFNVVDHVEKFAIGGGEPMIYPWLNKLMDELVTYSDRTGMIEIITNGTTVPKQSLIESVKKLKCRFRILIDNYGNELSKNVKEIDTILNNSSIPHDVRNYTFDNPHCGGWVNFGDLSIKKHNDDAARKLYAKCAYPQKMNFCFTIVDGVMYPCSPVRRCRELGVDDPTDYVDLFNDSLSIENKRNKILSIYNGDCLTACAYCNGMCDDSPRFIPAMQLTNEEIKTIRKITYENHNIHSVI